MKPYFYTITPIIIGICKEYQESRIFHFLDQIGIKSFFSTNPNDKNLLVKSSIHNNIKIIIVNSSSINNLLEKNIINVAICYENNISKNKKNLILKKNSSFHPISIIIAKKKNHKILSYPPRICCNCNIDIIKNYIENTNFYQQNKNTIFFDKISYIKKNCEYFIGDEFDIGILTHDSNISIETKGLEIIEYVWKNIDIAIHYNQNILTKEPRFIKSLENSILDKNNKNNKNNKHMSHL